MKLESVNLTTLREWLFEAGYAPLLEYARQKKRILSLLTALTYDTSSEVRARAIKASGLAAKIIVERDPEYVRNYLLRLFWLVNEESGGICWSAPELIGEILFHCPQFTQFFPMLISLLELEKEDAPRFRAGTLWAIGRVARAAPNAMQPALSLVRSLARTQKEAAVQEMAQWCLEQLTTGDEVHLP